MPHFLFCLDAKKEAKKIKAAPASHEKLRLQAEKIWTRTSCVGAQTADFLYRPLRLFLH